MHHWEIRQKIINLCLKMNSTGLNQGTSGNISARYKGTMLITPSGIPYEQLTPKDIVSMSLEHDRYEWDGKNKPSSEAHFHRHILRTRPEFGAVVHTHSTYTTAVSINRKSIPACHYMIAAFGGNSVRCADYATFGTPELSDNISKAMQDRSACILANHGLIAAGKDLDKAMWAAVELETLCKQYYYATQMGEMVVLPDDEMLTIIEKFKTYGASSMENK
jgi:L-fuculose-phosphate aldolase